MSRSMPWFVSAAALLIAVPARAPHAGLLDRVKEKAAAAVEKELDEQLEGSDDAPEQEEAPPPAKGKKAKPSTPPAPESAAAPPREVYGNRFDFVPGDKVLVFDDFSDTDVGEYPARWTMKDGGGNPVEVVEIGGKRFLKSRYQEDDQTSSLHWLRYAVKGDLPKEFTIEFDADVAGPFSVVFSNISGFGGQELRFNEHVEGNVTSPNASGKLPKAKGIQHVSIAVSGTQVKVYVGGERVLADSDAVERPISRIGMSFIEVSGFGAAGDHQLFSGFRLAEGGKPAKQMLAGEGRIVTHGILFDTASDVIKPESGPTLRTILALLNDDRALAFSIEGHTDDQGSASVNGPLSERRAASVKAWLVKQGVESTRLTTKGFGDTCPLDKSRTQEGRANNRRVEFVRVSAGK